MEPLMFGILGPLEARVGDRALTPAGPKRRALLAFLLLHHHRVVSVNRIIDALWADDPPASARTQVQTLVHALRQQLGAGSGSGPTIETLSPGYRLAVDSERVDLPVFARRA